MPELQVQRWWSCSAQKIWKGQSHIAVLDALLCKHGDSAARHEPEESHVTHVLPEELCDRVGYQSRLWMCQYHAPLSGLDMPMQTSLTEVAEKASWLIF